LLDAMSPADPQPDAGVAAVSGQPRAPGDEVAGGSFPPGPDLTGELSVDAARQAPLARVDARGRLRAVPLAVPAAGTTAGETGGTLAFVRPEYRRDSEGTPALARAVAVVGDSARVAPDPAAALVASAGVDEPPTGAPAAPGAGGDPLARARALYDASRAALRRGDWAAVGRALDALGRALGPSPAGPPGGRVGGGAAGGAAGAEPPPPSGP
jgi:hypothetical protein